MKQTIVTMYASAHPVAAAHSFRLLLRRLAALEHLEHAVGDDEAADDVAVPSATAASATIRTQPVWSGSEATMIAPTTTMPWMAFDPGHERRVQERRHLRDHLEAEERREDEHRQLDQEDCRHAAASFRVTHAPAVISSSQSSFSSPSGARCWSSAMTLRA